MLASAAWRRVCFAFRASAHSESVRRHSSGIGTRTALSTHKHQSELASARRLVAMRAIMDPPTRQAPPADVTARDISQEEWAECIVQYSSAPTADSSEVWVFRKKDYEEFQRLVGLRLSYRKPSGDDAHHGQADDRPSQFGDARREEAMAGVKVTCRDRNVDAELTCAECIRVFSGGVYKDAGIAVPAYPRQPNVVGCLELSSGAAGNDTAALELGGSAVNPLLQTAFCKYVHAKFESEMAAAEL
eukprot:CAMPEP_0178410128 /NCGR_PEP_ID=MMETSP0689_2-20121128/20819_1 /TAXON_ID=160604 /ORGANISM="Amphidinium massartii, Strain CS-259" /LENGTH=244 /DNA_ID=CAMNT_0020031293 /DNA_START=79 /DNA_END=811 /DNA_ORIENTATION=+